MNRIPVYECVLRKTKVLRLAEAEASCADQAAAIAHGLTHESPVELVVAIYLNCRMRLIGAEVVARGFLTGCAVSARDLVRGSIISNAHAMIIAHNHPSGVPDPSPEDIEMTRIAVAAAEVFGIEVLDHVIVTSERDNYFSFRESGLLPFTGPIETR